jgi:hypothetical protein
MLFHNRFRISFFLAREMVVHRALRYTGSRRDPVHAGDLETAAAEFSNRGLEDGFAFSLGEALRCGHGHSSVERENLHSAVYLAGGFMQCRNYTEWCSFLNPAAERVLSGHPASTTAKRNSADALGVIAS